MRNRPGMTLLLLLAALSALLLAAEGVERLPGEDGAGAGRPHLAPPPGGYESSRRLSLRPTHRRGRVVFTTDGAIPTSLVGYLYEGPLRLGAETPGVTVVRAVEVVEGEAGPPVTASYAVGLEGRLPVLSLVVEPAELWDTEEGVLAHPTMRGRAWERPAHATLIEEGGEVGFAVDAGLRVDEGPTPDVPKPSLRLYFRREYGPGRLGYPLFPQHPHQPATSQSFDRLLLGAGDCAGRWTLFRDQLVAEVATALGLRAAQGRFVHLFVNGESWGLYRLGERVDDSFLEDNYGLGEADLVQDGRPEEGRDDDWDALVDWVEGHDLSTPENLAYVEARVNLAELTDFAILQAFFGFPAEELYAARSAGGRWFWIYGGEGRSFASRVDAPVATLTGAGGDFGLLLRALLENEGYREGFARRAAVLLNTHLYPGALAPRVTTLRDALADDVAYEEARWPAPSTWEDNVALFEGFVAGRADHLAEELAGALGLGDPVALELVAEPAGAGRFYADGVPLPAGEPLLHFSGLPVELVALPVGDRSFAGWWEGGDALSLHPNLTLAPDGASSLTARFRDGDGDALRPNDVMVTELWINDDGTRYSGVDDRPIEGDWVELVVRRPGGVDLRGWRITDNDTKTGTDEGSLVLPGLEALASVPRDTVVLLLATTTPSNDAYFPADDLHPGDGRLLLYVGNGNLDVTTDPGFGVGRGNDNVVVLAPGPSSSFADDVGVDFVAEGREVTPYGFGVLFDGVVFEGAFRGLGDDDGALFVGRGDNDRGDEGWVVDPPAYESGDDFRLDASNLVTPGAPNPHGPRLPAWLLSLLERVQNPWWAPE